MNIKTFDIHRSSFLRSSPNFSRWAWDEHSHQNHRRRWS